MADYFERGPEAAEAVAADPFWSVVRRRHPDVDIVVLPPEAPAPRAEPPDLPVLDEQTAAELADLEADRLWRHLVGDDPPAEPTSRWLGEDDGVVRRETTLRLRDADPVAAVAAVERAAGLLRDEGWRVQTPPDGMPRVLAARDAQVQLVFAPLESVLALRVRSGDVRLAEVDA